MNPEEKEKIKREKILQKACSHMLKIKKDGMVFTIKMLTLGKVDNNRYETAYSATVSPIPEECHFYAPENVYAKDGYYESACIKCIHLQWVFDHICKEVRESLGYVPGLPTECHDYRIEMLPYGCVTVESF